MNNTKTVWIENFQGLNDSVSPGANPRLTNNLNNVKIQHGQVRPRGGLSPFPCFGYSGTSTAPAASANIIGLWTYQLANDFLSDLVVRMLPSKVEVLTDNTCWQTVITGLNSTATTLPQVAVIDDVMVFINEGINRPYKFEGNPSVNGSLIAGGIAPYAKCISAYVGFLMLGNVSDNGTFTDVFDGYRMIRYSDDWDVDWSSCVGNEIVLVETPGSLRAIKPLGQDLFCYKTDGIVRVHWTGGATRFSQKKLDFDLGILAPLSLASLADQKHCFLATDGVLYIVEPNGTVSAISYDSLYTTLASTISLNRLRFAKCLVDDEESTYYLFYDRTFLSDVLLDSYVSYNWKTYEFSKGTMGINLCAFTNHRVNTGAPQSLLAASPTIVYDFGNALTDDGVKINRFWTTGWINIGEEGWFVGARLFFKKPFKAEAIISISISSNLNETFRYKDQIRLKGKTTKDNFLEIQYNPPSIFGNLFNLKIEFSNKSLMAQIELRRIGLEITNVRTVSTQTTRAKSGAVE